MSDKVCTTASDRSACAKGPLCVSTDSYPDRVTTAWIERQLLLKAVVRDDKIIACRRTGFGQKRPLRLRLNLLPREFKACLKANK
jgi:hypothetical protein